MAAKQLVDITEIRNRYSIEENVESALKFGNYGDDLSKQFASLNDGQKKFFDAVTILLENLVTTQRKNIEIADVEFSRVILNNLSTQQLLWLNEALNEKYDEILSTVSSKLDSNQNLLKENINLFFKNQIKKDISIIFDNLKKKIAGISAQFNVNGKKTLSKNVKDNSKLDFSKIREKTSQISKDLKIVNKSVNLMSRNFLSIDRNFAKSNAILANVMHVGFSNNLTSLLDVSKSKISTNTLPSLRNYFLLTENVVKMFKEINSAYAKKVEDYDVSAETNRYTKKEKKQLSADFAFLKTNLKTIFTTTFIGDFLLAPIRLLKNGKAILNKVVGAIAKWVSIIFMPLVNLTKYGYRIFSDIFSTLLLPIKRLTNMTLKFATFLFKKASILVKVSFVKITSLLKSLLAPKTIFKSIVMFFKTPIGAYVLGFVIGKIQLIGKNFFNNVKEKVIKAIEIIKTKSEEFSNWFSETTVGKWMKKFFDDPIDSIDKMIDSLEKGGQYLLKIADSIASIDIFWLFEDFKDHIKETLFSMTGGSIGSIVGGIAGSALIPLVGPLGPVIGGILGSFAGEWLGKKLYEMTTGYFEIHDNKDAEIISIIRQANIGLKNPIDHMSMDGINNNSVVLSKLLDDLSDRLESTNDSDERKAIAKEIQYLASVKQHIEDDFSISGKFGRFAREYDANNKDKNRNGENISFDDKIVEIEGNANKEIHNVSKSIDDSVKTTDINTILSNTILQYDFYDKKASKQFQKVHPYRFRYFRALFIRDLMQKFKLGQLPAHEFVRIYNDLSDPNSKLYKKTIKRELSVHDMFGVKESNSEEIKPKYSFNKEESTNERYISYKYDPKNIANSFNFFAGEYDTLQKSDTSRYPQKDFEHYVNFLDLDKKADALIKYHGVNQTLRNEILYRMSQTLFLLLTNASNKVSDKEIADAFNGRYLGDLASILDMSKVFGSKEAGTQLESAVKSNLGSVSLSETVERSLEDSSFDVRTLFPSEPDTSEEQSAMQSSEADLQKIDENLKELREQYSQFDGGPSNPNKLQNIVAGVCNLIRNYGNHPIVPIISTGNLSIGYKNPTLAEASTTV